MILDISILFFSISVEKLTLKFILVEFELFVFSNTEL